MDKYMPGVKGICTVSIALLLILSPILMGTATASQSVAVPEQSMQEATPSGELLSEPIVPESKSGDSPINDTNEQDSESGSEENESTEFSPTEIDRIEQFARENSSDISSNSSNESATIRSDNVTEINPEQTNLTIEEWREELDVLIPLSGENYALRVELFPDGDYAILGRYQDLDQVYVARVSPSGSVEWVTDISLETAADIAMTPNGDVIAVGDNADRQPHLFRITGNGLIRYETAEFDDTTYAGVAVRDGLIYAVGSYQNSPVVVTHDLADGIDDARNPDLIRQFDDRSGRFYAIAETDTGFVTVGSLGESTTTGYTVSFEKASADLRLRWDLERGGLNPGSEEYRFVAVTSDNNIVAFGEADQSETGRSIDHLVTRFDASNGNVVWTQRFGSTAEDISYDVIPVGNRIMAMTYPGIDEIDDGRTAKVNNISLVDGSQEVVYRGFNEGDFLVSGVSPREDTVVIVGAGSPDVSGEEFGEFESALMRIQLDEQTFEGTEVLSSESNTYTVAAGSEVTVTYTVRNNQEQSRNILLELTSVPTGVSIKGVNGDIAQDVTGSTPPAVITSQLEPGEAATVQVTLTVEADAPTTDSELVAKATINAGADIAATDTSTVTLSVTEQSPLVARFGGDDNVIGNFDVLRAVNAANSGGQIGGEPVTNFDVLRVVNHVNSG